MKLLTINFLQLISFFLQEQMTLLKIGVNKDVCLVNILDGKHKLEFGNFYLEGYATIIHKKKSV